MPSPRFRTQRRRGPLDDAEVAELLAGGPAPGEPSVFADASAFLSARGRLDAERAEWEPLTTWLHESRAGRIKFKRHMAHIDDAPLADPRYPALVNTDTCPLCNQADR